MASGRRGVLVRQTVVHIPSFQGQYKTGLVFSMIESLKVGESFKLVCEESPSELVALLKEAGIPNLDWRIDQADESRWSMVLSKATPEDDPGVGCCGLCGGASKKERGV